MTDSKPIEAPAADLATMDRPLDARGNPMSDIDLLNQMIEAYRMRSASTTKAVLINGRKPQGPVEEAEAMAAAQSGPPPLKDISDLITLGFVKAIPAAPAGKKYVLDTASQHIKLVDAK